MAGCSTEKKEAFKFTGEDAENYDTYLGPILFEPYGQFIALQVAAEKPGSVLEIACGTGRVTRQLRKSLPATAKLIASDISGDMLAVAKRELDGHDIEFKVEDAQSLSFPDNSFDLVICQFGMMFLPDKQKGFNEIYRVLKPGGKFMCLTWDNMLNIPICKLIFNDLVVPLFHDEDTTRFYVPFSMHNPQQLKDWMQNAGFTSTEVDTIVLNSGPHEVKNVVDAYFRKHMMGKEVMAKDPSAFEPIAREFEEEIGRQYGAADPVFELSALLTVGQK